MREHARNLSHRVDCEIGEGGRALPELPPPVNARLNEGRAAAVDERDDGHAVGDGVAVGLMEPLEAAAVAPLLPGPFDELVEALVGEAALVRPARRLEEQP